MRQIRQKPAQPTGLAVRGRAHGVNVIVPSAGHLGPDGLPLLKGTLELVDGQARVSVVVTNGDMNDAGRAMCDRWGVQIIEVNSPSGFNFSRAVNAAVSCSDAGRILLLNDDVSGPARRDWLSWWLAQDVLLSGVALRWPGGQISHRGIRWGGAGEMPSHSRGRHQWLLPPGHRTLAVTGAAMLFDRRLYDRIGGFCEDLPLNYNDIDFCVQALALGVRPRQFNRVVLTHWESATRGITPPTDAELELFERRCGRELTRYGVRVSAAAVLALDEIRTHETPGTSLAARS